jgi:2-dehydropantoate 2-reductase
VRGWRARASKSPSSRATATCEAIGQHGFRLILPDGQQEHTPAGDTLRAVQDPRGCGCAGLRAAHRQGAPGGDLLPGLRGLFGPQTAVVSMINGVPWWYFHRLAGPHQGRGLQCLDPDGRISRHIEPERVIGSVVYPACELVAPGVVRIIEGNRFSLGEPDGSRSERVELLSRP